MDKAKEIAVQQKRRAIILETQSCNTDAIEFYLHQGFELIGLDTCCFEYFVVFYVLKMDHIFVFFEKGIDSHVT